MAKKIGMDPARVEGLAAQLDAQDARLSEVAAAVERAALASANPLSWGIQPGGFIVAPFSIGATAAAALQVRLAMNAADDLIRQILSEAAEQRAVSGPQSRMRRDAWGKTSKSEALSALLAGDLSPEEVAALFRGSELTNDDLDGLPIEQIATLAMLEGLRGSARDHASRILLDYAENHPEDAYELLGFTGSETSLDTFKSQIAELSNTLDDAANKSKALGGNPTIQLLGLGNHDGQLVAAISLGDIDSSSHIAVNVPGMNSDLDGIANGFAGATEVYKSAKQADLTSSYAVVSWWGYNSPGLNEVRSMDRADAGATQLVGFLDGIHASRQEYEVTIENFSVLAHSYGSTTATEALKVTNYQINDYVMYGSAGIENGTKITDLNADTVHSTAAAGDNLRWAGYTGGVRTDPNGLDDVQSFSSEEVDGRDSVTAHDMWSDGGGSFWNWGGKRGYFTEGTNSVYEIGRIVAGVEE